MLPGESLAKYTGPDRGMAVGSVVDVEPAIPVEHDLPGLTWSAPHAPAAEKEAAPAAPVAEDEISHPQLIPTAEAPEETLTEEDEEIILAAAEAVEAIHEEALDEIATGVPLSEVEAEAEAEESGDVFDLPEGDDESEDLETAPAAATASGEQPAGEEGPEPARIPTSLTAQLREQGHRYPHRVSRRSRRRGGRNRGDQGENREDRGPKPVGETPATEAVAALAVPDEPALKEMKTSEMTNPTGTSPRRRQPSSKRNPGAPQRPEAGSRTRAWRP